MGNVDIMVHTALKVKKIAVIHLIIARWSGGSYITCFQIE